MRMAMTILANALTFQSLLAGFERVPTLAELRHQGALPKHAVVAAWEVIQQINYAPIFKILRSSVRTAAKTRATASVAGSACLSG